MTQWEFTFLALALTELELTRQPGVKLSCTVLYCDNSTIAVGFHKRITSLAIYDPSTTEFDGLLTQPIPASSQREQMIFATETTNNDLMPWVQPSVCEYLDFDCVNAAHRLLHLLGSDS